MVISELSPEYIIQPKNTKDKRVSRSPNTQDRQTHTGTSGVTFNPRKRGGLRVYYLGKGQILSKLTVFNYGEISAPLNCPMRKAPPEFAITKILLHEELMQY